MERKFNLSTGLVALSIIGNIFSIISGANDVIDLFGLITFPVSFLYHSLMAIGITGFISMYLDHRKKKRSEKAMRDHQELQRLEYENIEKMRTTGDWSISDVFDYILMDSSIGRSFIFKVRLIQAEQIIESAYDQGSITIFGILGKKGMSQMFDPENLAGYNLVIVMYKDMSGVDYCYLRSNDEKKIITSPTFLSREIKSLFPKS